MAAGFAFFGGLQRDLVAAMRSYSDDELAVVHRFLTEMTEVIVAHQRPEGGREGVRHGTRLERPAGGRGGR